MWSDTVKYIKIALLNAFWTINYRSQTMELFPKCILLANPVCIFQILQPDALSNRKKLVARTCKKGISSKDYRYFFLMQS